MVGLVPLTSRLSFSTMLSSHSSMNVEVQPPSLFPESDFVETDVTSAVAVSLGFVTMP